MACLLGLGIIIRAICRMIQIIILWPWSCQCVVALQWMLRCWTQIFQIRKRYRKLAWFKTAHVSLSTKDIFQPHLTVHNGQVDQTGEYTIALQWECFWIAVQYLASLVVNIALKCIVGIENAGWNPGRKCVASDVLPVLHCRHCIASAHGKCSPSLAARTDSSWEHSLIFLIITIFIIISICKSS